jgi:hypothetical protein
MSLSNVSGTIVFRFTADGTSMPGTDHINFSFGVGNATTPPEPPSEGWIGPMEMMLFGTGVSLRPTGPSTDPWTRWSFRLGLRVPQGTDPEDLIDLFGGILGNETPEMGDLDLSFLDPSILEDMDGVRVHIYARAYRSDGDFGTAERDITTVVVPELLEFARSEGLLDDDIATDDDDEDGSDDDGPPYAAILISLFIVGEVLLIGFVVHLVRKRRSSMVRNR